MWRVTVQDIRPDLRERLAATVKQRSDLLQQVRALEDRERRLRALLREEEIAGVSLDQSSAVLASGDTSGGAFLRDFVLGSLADGHSWSLEALKEHAHAMGLATVGTAGRSLNITLVNLLRQGCVKRLQDGKWRLCHQSRQLPLGLAPPSSEPDRDGADAGAQLAS
jgi:hypothetical protein